MADTNLIFTTMENIQHRIEQYLSTNAPGHATLVQADPDEVCYYATQAEQKILATLRKVYTVPSPYTPSAGSKLLLAEIAEKFAGADAIPAEYIADERGDTSQGYSQRLRNEADRLLMKLCNRELILDDLTLLPVTTTGTTAVTPINRIGIARSKPPVIESPF